MLGDGVLPHVPRPTPQLRHLTRCWAREAPGSPLQVSNAVPAASTAAATSSACAWRQLAKLSPGEMNGGIPDGKSGGARVELEGAEISRAQAHPKAGQLVPSSVMTLLVIALTVSHNQGRDLSRE